MAIQKEIWLSSIVGHLFANNSFLSKSFNADEYVNAGRTVHIPNAGAASRVVKGRSSLPASVQQRTDTVLSFDLDEFTTDPILIPYADTVELSYDKRESVLRGDKLALFDAVAKDFILKWSPEKSSQIIKTTGSAVVAHTPAGTGNRKAFVKSDVNAAMVKFNMQDIPQEGRYMLVDANMYAQLLDSLTDREAQAFFAQADVANGVLGKLYSFNFYMRSTAGVYAAAGTPKLYGTTPTATDDAAAIAWHDQAVCRALGETQAFEKENDPTFYGDIYSFLVRAGGRPMRSDEKGILAIVQAKA
ncbi:major capsid protein [Porphyromonas phage phage007a_Bg4]|uniref:Major capsid n=5 Tax=Viruses TaxID=10239 RepID=A0AAT9J854_9VIRU|nr:hypothetical protein [Porphyromonas gingivalis]MCE8190768.1 hypothetical protein [Porphyromonas gingivalis]MDH7902941.1 hypothetical protein [Porphyromonas gingivalis]OWP32475.1 hypothetical protein CBG53_03175 [Porphyromonas gingivalis]PDP75005.1 hypothetical protein CLI79_06335 [Porphyromonas gingivalis]PDP77825.1 hypothetical protein CLI76_02085 [Porphyromonas gingivalis]